jgi:hypothetical protein
MLHALLAVLRYAREASTCADLIIALCSIPCLPADMRRTNRLDAREVRAGHDDQNFDLSVRFKFSFWWLS